MKTKRIPQLAIALYSSSSSNNIQWHQWMEWSRELASHGDMTITHFDVSLVRRTNKLKTGKAYGIQYEHQLQEQIRNSNIDRISLTSIKESSKSIATDWNFTSVLDQRHNTIQLIVGFSTDCFSKWGNVEFINDSVVKMALSFFQPDYGFCVCDDPLTMPVGYGHGVPSSRLPETMIYDANAWLAGGIKQCHVALRNVYGYNLVNTNHLEATVWNLTLKEWIHQDPNRGMLHPINPKLTQWDFRAHHDHEYLAFTSQPVTRVRVELEKFLLFPWQALPGTMSR